MQQAGHLSKRLLGCRICRRVVHDSVEPAWKPAMQERIQDFRKEGARVRGWSLITGGGGGK